VKKQKSQACEGALLGAERLPSSGSGARLSKHALLSSGQATKAKLGCNRGRLAHITRLAEGTSSNASGQANRHHVRACLFWQFLSPVYGQSRNRGLLREAVLATREGAELGEDDSPTIIPARDRRRDADRMVLTISLCCRIASETGMMRS